MGLFFVFWESEWVSVLKTCRSSIVRFLGWKVTLGSFPCLIERYIGDIVGATSLPLADLQKFINYTNNFHPNLQFTHSITENSLPFLEILAKPLDRSTTTLTNKLGPSYACPFAGHQEQLVYDSWWSFSLPHQKIHRRHRRSNLSSFGRPPEIHQLHE